MDRNVKNNLDDLVREIDKAEAKRKKQEEKQQKQDAKQKKEEEEKQQKQEAKQKKEEEKQQKRKVKIDNKHETHKILVKEGDKYYNGNSFTQAAKSYTQAMKLKPHNLSLKSKLAKCLYTDATVNHHTQNRKYQLLKKAKKLNPRDFYINTIYNKIRVKEELKQSKHIRMAIGAGLSATIIGLGMYGANIIGSEINFLETMAVTSAAQVYTVAMNLVLRPETSKNNYVKRSLVYSVFGPMSIILSAEVGLAMGVIVNPIAGIITAGVAGI